MSIVPNWQNVRISSTVNLTRYSISYPVKTKRQILYHLSNLEAKVQLSQTTNEQHFLLYYSTLLPHTQTASSTIFLETKIPAKVPYSVSLIKFMQLKLLIHLTSLFSWKIWNVSSSWDYFIATKSGGRHGLCCSNTMLSSALWGPCI